MSERPVVARVLPESRLPQLDRTFDYRVPPGMTVAPGVRVKIPLGRGGKTTTGFVRDLVEHSDFAGHLADVEAVVSDAIVVPSHLFDLASQVAARQAGSTADVLRLAVPARAVRVEKEWLAREERQRSLPQPPEASDFFGVEQWSTLHQPSTRHWWQLPYGVCDAPAGLPTPIAHREIAQFAAHVLAGGKSVIISAPDWRDTSHLTVWLEKLVGQEFLARFDSDLPSAERYQHYLRCLEPDPVVAVGARHAIYAPVKNVGAIVVLNDADSAHREPLSPYPHTRDVALLRAEQSQSAVVLAGYSPSIAVHRLRFIGFLTDLIPAVPTRPRVIPTALTGPPHHDGVPARLPSLAYQAIKRALADGPVLIQVFRAGFAPGVACDSCGTRSRCGSCQGPLRFADSSSVLRCGWCGQLAGTWRCLECGTTKVRPIGHAVGRTVTELGKAFPGVQVIQADGEHPRLTLSNTPALVVATRGAEPVATGGYTAALLLDGESIVQRTSLEALTDAIYHWEGALSLLRSDSIAYLTDLTGFVAQAMASGALDNLLTRELTDRQALRLPPAVRLAVVEGDATTVDDTLGALVAAVGSVETIGPLKTAGGQTRVLVKAPYALAPHVATELRAAVISHASARRRGSLKLRVSMEGSFALDQLSAEAQ